MNRRLDEATLVANEVADALKIAREMGVQAVNVHIVLLAAVSELLDSIVAREIGVTNDNAVRVVGEVAAFFRDISRNAGVRMNEDWPDDEFNRVKSLVDDCLYPDPPIDVASEPVDSESGTVVRSATLGP